MSTRHILITGPPGVGKTTLIKKVFLKLKEKNENCEGFYTEEVRNGRERIGFDIVTLTEKRGILARVSSPSCRISPKVGKYSVDVLSFETLALPVFQSSSASILILDEIGKMESFSRKFCENVRAVFSRTNLKILATIPLKHSLTLVEELKNHKDCKLVQVNRENRNDLVDDIVNYLLENV